MNLVNRFAFFFILSSILILPLASADIPRLISLQGRLTDASDNPITSSTNFAFRIYEVPAGGTALWTEFQTLAPNSLGVFSALLGSVAALNIPFNASYWLEVQVNSEVLSPRTRMGSAGYALRSENPWNATGNNIYTTNAGNVGIGLSNPSEKLEVSGTVKATAFKGNGSQLSGIASSQWTTSGSNIYYNAGNVGIGITNPGNAKLNVSGNIALSGAGNGIIFSDGSTQISAASGGVSTRWIYNSNTLQSAFSYTFPSSNQRIYVTECSSDPPASFAIYGSRISAYTASSYARCFNEQTRGCTTPNGESLGALPGVNCGYTYSSPWCCGGAYYGSGGWYGGCPGGGCSYPGGATGGYMDNFYRCTAGDVCAKWGDTSPGLCCPGAQPLYRSADGYCYDSYTNVDMVKVGSCSYAEIEKSGTVNFAFDKGVNHFEITYTSK